MESNGKNAGNHTKRSDNNASPWQNVLAVRVTTIISKIEEICKELRAWPWSGEFEIEKSLPNDKVAVQELLSAPRNQTDLLNLLIKPESLSLSYSQVNLYQHRLEKIFDELKRLGINRVKDDILYLVRSSQATSCINDSLNSSAQNCLDEMSATVVDTFVQALPRISTLRAELSIWSTRLSVFFEAFNFVGNHNKSVKAVNSALSGQLRTHLLIHELSSLDRRINLVIAESGKHLDLMLDMLVDNKDMLPKGWLKKFEDLNELYIHFRHNLLLQFTRPELNFWPLKIYQHLNDCEGVKVTKATKLADDTEITRIEFSEDENTELVKNFYVTREVTEFTHNPEQSALCLGHLVIDQKNEFAESPCISGNLVTSKSSEDPDTSNDVVENCKNITIPFLTYSAESQHFILDDDQNQVLDKSTAGIEKAKQDKKMPDRNPNQPSIDLKSDSAYPSEFTITPFPSVKTPSTPESALQIYTESSGPKSPCVQYASRRRISRMPAPPLNSIFRKCRRKGNVPDTWRSQYLALSEGNSIVSKDLSVEDRISNHISEILEPLPSNEQSKGGVTTDDPTQMATIQTRKPRSSSAWVSTSYNKLVVIKAASSVARSYRSDILNANQDVKTHHLCQRDERQTTKLLVRLVGEHDEQVMVRVGGGWVDLEVYLRQHAGIYGRRVVSDNTFDFYNVPKLRTTSTVSRSSPAVSTTLNKSPGSCSEICSQAKTHVGKRPTLSKSDISNSRQAVDLSISSTIHMQRSKIRSRRTLSTSQDKSHPTTPTTPSPLRSDLRLSPLGSGSGDEFGLARSEPIRRELSDETSQLVDIVDSKTESVSASFADIPTFGDLGLVGKTKRVWPKRCAHEAVALARSYRK